MSVKSLLQQYDATKLMKFYETKEFLLMNLLFSICI